MGRLISIALQSNIDVSSIIKTMRGIQTKNISWHQTKGNSIPIRSVPDAVAHALADTIHNEQVETINNEQEVKVNISETEEKINIKKQCEMCGENSLIHSEGCSKCLSCSYSSCG